MLPEKKRSLINKAIIVPSAQRKLSHAGALGEVLNDLLKNALTESDEKAMMIAHAVLALPKNAPIASSLKQAIKSPDSSLYQALNFHRNHTPVTFFANLYRSWDLLLFSFFLLKTSSLFIYGLWNLLLLSFFSLKTRSLIIAEKACSNIGVLELEYIKSGNLTAEAAQFMLENKLTIRNSYTKQLLSLHYKLKTFPETHAPGLGRYCVPLWTVAIPGLMDVDFTTQGKKVESLINNFSYSSCSYSIAAAQQQPKHLKLFLNRIKQFISEHIVLGMSFNHKFDYELIVATSDNMSLDDLGRYPTGGRAYNVQNARNIVYRATLNSKEITFLKNILRGDYDAQIPGIFNVDSCVAKSARQQLAHELCLEIISRKLVCFLNAAGQLKNVISFCTDMLESLITNVVSERESEVINITKQGLVRFDLQRTDELLNKEKYSPYPM